MPGSPFDYGTLLIEGVGVVKLQLRWSFTTERYQELGLELFGVRSAVVYSYSSGLSMS